VLVLDLHALVHFSIIVDSLVAYSFVLIQMFNEREDKFLRNEELKVSFLVNISSLWAPANKSIA